MGSNHSTVSTLYHMPTKRTANSETRKNTATTSSTASNPSVRPCITVQDPPGPLRDAKTPLTCIDDGKKNFHQDTITAPQTRPQPQTHSRKPNSSCSKPSSNYRRYMMPHAKQKPTKSQSNKPHSRKSPQHFNRMTKSKQKHPHPRPCPLQKM